MNYIFSLILFCLFCFGTNGQYIDYATYLNADMTHRSLATPFISSNLPLLIINTHGITIVDEPKIDADLGIINNPAGSLNYLTDSFNGYNGKIGIELRGSSSLWFAKKGYGMETRLSSGENNNVELLGLPQENDWVLHGPYADKSLMRNVLSYHIGNVMGSYTPRTKWCELFINDEYLGVYVLVERIKRDKNRVDIANLKPEDISGNELSGGYIFSVDRGDEGPESGWRSPYTNVFFRYQDPDWDELKLVQKDYLRNHISQFEKDISHSSDVSVIERYIDIPSWINYWIATEVFKHIDNYKFSFFMHKKKNSNGGKIHFGPLWDLNLGYGNFNFAQSPAPDGWSYEWAKSGGIRPTWVYTLSSDETLQNRINCRWTDLRAGALHTDTLMSFIDSTAAYLDEAQARNFERWPILGNYVWPNSFVGATYEEEVDFLKQWLTDRLDWMDENMLGTCMVGIESQADESDLIYINPNPFHDEIKIDLSGMPIEKGRLILTNALSKIYLASDVNKEGVTVLNLSSYPNGIYFYHLYSQGHMVGFGQLLKH